MLGVKEMVRSSKRKASATPSCGVILCNKRNKTAAVPVSLPDEMLMQVLLRLPIKAILRFRAVCRSWAALLSSDEFRCLHMEITRTAEEELKLLVVSPTERFDSTDVYSCSPLGPRRNDQLLFTLDHARRDSVKVLTPIPCHGLTLLFDDVTPAYYLCNAATRAVTRLPPFGEALDSFSAGLGFDVRRRQHKVVRLINKMGMVKCEVYTPGSDCWRPAARGVPFRLCRVATSALCNAEDNTVSPMFANGCLHWLVAPYNLNAKPRTAILSFSVAEETFTSVRAPTFGPTVRTLPFPFIASGGLTDQWFPWHWAGRASEEHLTVVDNQLCMVRDLRTNPYGSTLEIWKLLDYSAGHWSLNHCINLSGRAGRDLREPQIVSVIGNCRPGKKIIIASSTHKVHDTFKKQVHTYDPSSGALKTILSVTETHTSLNETPPGLRFGLIEESLTPVHKTGEEITLSLTLAKVTKEILLRLPAKSAVQSKAVCKQWLRLIESENFIEIYSKHKNMDKRPKIMLIGKGSGHLGFSFAPLNRWIREAPKHIALLCRKVICSKPCNGLNLISTETDNYLYNACTGFYRVYHSKEPKMHLPSRACRVHKAERHAFTVGNKNVGLTFDPLTREHVVVEMSYNLKDYKSRQYNLECTLRWCNSEGHARENSIPVPPLPVNEMPPAYVEGLLYWMSEPRLGRSHKRAIVSFDIARNKFDVISCPPCIAMWNSTSCCRAHVVELEGVLCAILADPVANSLDVWKLEHGQWGRSYSIFLKAWPDYSLGTNVVVPFAVDPYDSRILLNSGRKVGLYDPVERTVETLYSLDQVHGSASMAQLRVCQGSEINKCRHSDPWDPSLSGSNLTCSKDQSSWEINRLDSEFFPLVPMLYEDSLAWYPRVAKARMSW
ncbi:hypothetical protein QYE76_035036 [Lolium multiflorum]|uniref:F-box domain-containing protein n=1 Tax=Lolium multiflorum TaxID=4521 RepID=A0AAD8QYG4_LOLMU|nr:hypothetical protein QYE76_035036 [Lolium multiflorum]